MSSEEIVEDQKLLCLLLDNAHYWRPHYRFISDLKEVVLENDENLTEKQLPWVKHYLYKYRDQIRENVFYNEDADSETYERLRGESIFDKEQHFDKIIEHCKQYVDHEPEE